MPKNTFLASFVMICSFNGKLKELIRKNNYLLFNLKPFEFFPQHI